MSRPSGSKNAKPSKLAIAAYLKLLQKAADDGDTNAAGWLVATDKLEERNAPEWGEHLRLATIVAAHVPEHLWPYLSKELRSDADAVTDKIRALAEKEAAE